MAKVFDNAAVAAAFRDASAALRRGDPDTLAGRFTPPPPKAGATAARPIAAAPTPPPRKRASGG